MNAKIVSLKSKYAVLCVAGAVILGSLMFVKPASADTNAARKLMEQVHSRVKFYKLENGLRVILYRRGVAPVFGGVVSVGVGGADELQGHTGISHLLEHMAFKGTEVVGTRDFSKEKSLLEQMEQLAAKTNGGTALSPEQQTEWAEIEQKLQKLWINNDFFQQYEARGASGMNATTSADSTNYFNSFPRDAFEFWCQMESNRIKNPVMRQFYKERDVVMEERRSRFEDAPDGKLYEQLLSTAYTLHPYRNPVIGYEADLRTVMASQVQAFHRRFYVPENIVVALVGDIDPDRDIETVKRYFGDIPTGPMPKRLAYVEPEQRGEKRVTLEIKSSPVMYVAYHKPPYPNVDDPKLSILLEMLAGSSISPLYEELVKKQQLAASVSFEEAPGIKHASLMVFSMSAKSPHTGEDLLRVFDAVIKKFLEKPIDADAVARAKRAMAVDFIRGLDSDLGLAKDLASSELLFGDWRATLEWFDQLMAVTPADVAHVAQRYLRPENRTIAQIVQEQGAK